MVVLMELHNQVKENRIRLELTQETLAKLVSVTRQTIIAIEKGGYSPSVELALKLARALETPLEQLFWLDEDRKGSSS
jgi:putative transcriptional regulator